jgi:hypothetical protein
MICIFFLIKLSILSSLYFYFILFLNVDFGLGKKMVVMDEVNGENVLYNVNYEGSGY